MTRWRTTFQKQTNKKKKQSFSEDAFFFSAIPVVTCGVGVQKLPGLDVVLAKAAVAAVRLGLGEFVRSVVISTLDADPLVVQQNLGNNREHGKHLAEVLRSELKAEEACLDGEVHERANDERLVLIIAEGEV